MHERQIFNESGSRRTYVVQIPLHRTSWFVLYVTPQQQATPVELCQTAPCAVVTRSYHMNWQKFHIQVLKQSILLVPFLLSWSIKWTVSCLLSICNKLAILLTYTPSMFYVLRLFVLCASFQWVPHDMSKSSNMTRCVTRRQAGQRETATIVAILDQYLWKHIIYNN